MTETYQLDKEPIFWKESDVVPPTVTPNQVAIQISDDAFMHLVMYEKILKLLEKIRNGLNG